MKITFPKDLATIVYKRWEHMVAGQYVTPPCPPEKLLRELLENVAVAAAMPEEGLYPQFNVIAIPNPTPKNSYLGKVWWFNKTRVFSTDELRRLAPACDLRKSAIVVQWTDKKWEIAGLTDLGTHWNRARLGLTYKYRFPECLFIHIDRPNRIRVYQGQFLVAELTDGRLARHKGFELPLVLGAPTHNGIQKIWRKLRHPTREYERDYESFLFGAFWNTFAAIANCISESGHGGAVIIVSAESRRLSRWLQIKYPHDSDVLREAFINFMNVRNRVVDFIEQMEAGDISVKGEWAVAELELTETQEILVDSTRFVAQLARCDGAIVLSEDFRLLGFGAEIRAEFNPIYKVREIVDGLRGKYRELDVEQFGLRHRSAIKFVSRYKRSQVIVSSQDGPISIVWSDDRTARMINVARGVQLVNSNLPWA